MYLVIPPCRALGLQCGRSAEALKALNCLYSSRDLQLFKVSFNTVASGQSIFPRETETQELTQRLLDAVLLFIIAVPCFVNDAEEFLHVLLGCTVSHCKIRLLRECPSSKCLRVGQTGGTERGIDALHFSRYTPAVHRIVRWG